MDAIAKDIAEVFVMGYNLGVSHEARKRNEQVDLAVDLREARRTEEIEAHYVNSAFAYVEAIAQRFSRRLADIKVERLDGQSGMRKVSFWAGADLDRCLFSADVMALHDLVRERGVDLVGKVLLSPHWVPGEPKARAT